MARKAEYGVANWRNSLNAYILALIGVIASALGVYIAASFSLAQKQLMAATRLQAYLMHWSQWLLDVGAFPIYFLGHEWDKEEQALIKNGGGPPEMQKLQDEKKKLRDEIIAKLQEDDNVLNFDNKKLVEALSNLPKEMVSSLLDFSKTQRQNLILGQTFITDEEAATLGMGVAYKSITLKMGAIELIDTTVYILVSLVTAPERFVPQEHMDEAKKLLWRAMVISKEHCALTRAVQLFTTRTVLELTLRNIRSGSRITKR